MKIRRHVPDYVEVSDDFQREFEAPNQAQLLMLPWIQDWSQDPHFHRFVQSDNMLMAELWQGREWWVLGRMIEGKLDLPVWHPPT